MHRANDEEKQLLKQPVALDQFISMPFVKSIFFLHGLKFDKPTAAVLNTDSKGNTEVKVRLSSAESVKLTHKLTYSDAKNGDIAEFGGMNLNQFVFHSVVDGLALYSVQVPKRGSFLLQLFAGAATADSLDLACSFKIVCKSLVVKASPLPCCAGTEWGPRRGERLFGFKALTHHDGAVKVNGNLEMKFALPTKLRFLCKLHRNGVNSKALQQCVNVDVSDNSLVVKVNLPKAGQYALEIYAQKPDASDKTEFANACKYLLNATV